MIKITLPDGSVRELEDGASPLDLALGISKSLAKAALFAKVNGQDWDLKRPFEGDADVALITKKDEDEALELVRHDTAHILAQAVQDLYPGTQVTIGPAIENGFYYDFAREEPFSTDDFEAIEKRMREIVDANLPFEREVWDRDEAIAKFKEMGESFKAELIEDLPAGEPITIYRQGDWFDLCRGPHLPSTGKIGKAFKLMKVAGAYWRGDHRNAQLQRIYGTAWLDDKQLKAHLHRLEEAEKRDHRRLGKQMGLFHFQEEGPGSIFWHPNGWSLFQSLISYMRRRQENAGYVEINTPDLLDYSLWETSGHAEKFGENMYSTVMPDERKYALKPMNCPGGVQVYNFGQRSYRELPLRMAEFGKVHRYEPSGALHGMMRVRHFTQDDAHIFCTPEQLQEECLKVVDLILDIYKDFGFDDVRIKFSDRPEARIGEDEVWDKSEAALKHALEATGLPYGYNPGEGAFYGPKLEFVLRDAIGRDWQCGTIQVDFNLPERFDVTFTGEDGADHRPVMLHRALFGSLERFTGILIEHYAGKLPFWLAPRQIVVATITSDADAYAEDVRQVMAAAGLRVETDLRNEKINYKVREHSVGKVPVIAVVGRKEAEEGAVALRFLGEEGRTQEVMSLDDAIAQLSDMALAPDLKRKSV
ncbi:MAG: threonine--tRNA ligase [Maricaulis sp.]|uniref:threonine--tRNA ligase n=1 Tax=Maricaulis sp. TaxID=1486257 RepID=UPI00262146A6|nr:threonine--tRNA ligase [Maricaulis sp.]MDM7984872.1 threonine--tRNA ligase [Maricaulis sp.]